MSVESIICDTEIVSLGLEKPLKRRNFASGKPRIGLTMVS